MAHTIAGPDKKLKHAAFYIDANIPLSLICNAKGCHDARSNLRDGSLFAC